MCVCLPQRWHAEDVFDATLLVEGRDGLSSKVLTQLCSWPTKRGVMAVIPTELTLTVLSLAGRDSAGVTCSQQAADADDKRRLRYLR
jgi:hypothetical protein